LFESRGKLVHGRSDRGDDDFVVFHMTGQKGAGAYRCSDCGYGITIRGELPVCPMCSGERWEPTEPAPLRTESRSPAGDRRSTRRPTPGKAPSRAPRKGT
jgi:hypothetical protein